MEYNVLQTENIIETIGRLEDRISERFPNSSLSQVCHELHDISNNTQARVQFIKEPMRVLRIVVWAVCSAIVLLTLAALIYFSGTHGEIGLVEFVGLSDALLNSIVLIGAAIFFLLSLEKRFKRFRALKAIDELRSIAHIIDMHQLTKHPDRLRKQRYIITESSPRVEMTHFELRRYLDYCSELLSLTAKVGAVYVQHLDDEVCLMSGSELETLCTGLSRKIWQKILLLNMFFRDDDARDNELLH